MKILENLTPDPHDPAIPTPQLMLDLPDKHTFRPEEVGQIFNVSKRTIYRWVEEKRLKAIRLPGGRIRISHAELCAFLREIL